MISSRKQKRKRAFLVKYVNFRTGVNPGYNARGTMFNFGAIHN